MPRSLARLHRSGLDSARFKRRLAVGALAAATAAVSAVSGQFASGIEQDCSSAAGVASPRGTESSSNLLSLLEPGVDSRAAGAPGTKAGGQDSLTSLLLDQPKAAKAGVQPDGVRLADATDETPRASALAGSCGLSFDLETGDSGEVDIQVRGGASGDAFGGDARGGSSSAVGRSGDVVVAGNGGSGGSAGGSGPYAGAVIGNNSDGGGGNGGNGGFAICIGGPTGRDGRSCSSGDVLLISGNGGNAAGGDATSGDGGLAGVEESGSGNSGSSSIR